MDKITIDGLGKAIQNIVDEYTDDAIKVVQDTLPTVGKKAVKQLKANSPKQTGKYAKGWKWKFEKGRLMSTVTVYNKTSYQLTHLLEKGHANRDGGKTDGIEHIEPTEKMAVKEAIQLIERGLR